MKLFWFVWDFPGFRTKCPVSWEIPQSETNQNTVTLHQGSLGEQGLCRSQCPYRQEERKLHVALSALL